MIIKKYLQKIVCNSMLVWLRTGSNPADSNRFRSHIVKRFPYPYIKVQVCVSVLLFVCLQLKVLLNTQLLWLSFSVKLLIDSQKVLKLFWGRYFYPAKRKIYPRKNYSTTQINRKEFIPCFTCRKLNLSLLRGPLILRSPILTHSLTLRD